MTTYLLHISESIKVLLNHLRLSVSSTGFYQNVFFRYKGYGLKYIFVLSVVSSMLCTAILLNYAGKIKDYLDSNIISSETGDIDFVLSQIPTINFDGAEISIESDEEILTINNLGNRKFLIIDIDNKLTPSDRVKIPILLQKDQMRINLFDQEGKTVNSLPIKYNKIFGSEPRTFTKENIKTAFSNILKFSSQLIIYIVFPVLTIIIMINTLLDKAFMILIILAFVKVVRIRRGFQDCVRVVLFASGFYVLFQFVALIGSVELNYLLRIIQTWSIFLMMGGIIKSNTNLSIFRR